MICIKLDDSRDHNTDRIAMPWKMCNFFSDMKFTREAYYAVLEFNCMDSFYSKSTSFVEHDVKVVFKYKGRKLHPAL